MRFSGLRSDALQRALTRAGTAVWLLVGIALLAATLRSQRAALAGAATPPAVAAALISPSKPEVARAAYQPAGSLVAGEELVLIFIGASFCNAQNTPGFPGVVETAKLRLQEQARASGMSFRVVGVALDWRAADGLAFLERFGEFDEVASGSNWISDGATKYIWRDIPGDADVPQMLVLRRSVETGQAIRLGEDRVVKRIRGTTDIKSWVAAGATL